MPAMPSNRTAGSQTGTFLSPSHAIQKMGESELPSNSAIHAHTLTRKVVGNDLAGVVFCSKTPSLWFIMFSFIVWQLPSGSFEHILLGLSANRALQHFLVPVGRSWHQ